jgi:hypothetical protein
MAKSRVVPDVMAQLLVRSAEAMGREELKEDSQFLAHVRSEFQKNPDSTPMDVAKAWQENCGGPALPPSNASSPKLQRLLREQEARDRTATEAAATAGKANS